MISLTKRNFSHEVIAEGDFFIGPSAVVGDLWFFLWVSGRAQAFRIRKGEIYDAGSGLKDRMQPTVWTWDGNADRPTVFEQLRQFSDKRIYTIAKGQLSYAKA